MNPFKHQGWAIIQIVGVENVNEARAPSPTVKLYGYRAADTAKRLIMFEASLRDATDIVTSSELAGHFPEVEIDDRAWVYVGLVPKNSVRFDKDYTV